jgi:hypothetical protein
MRLPASAYPPTVAVAFALGMLMWHYGDCFYGWCAVSEDEEHYSSFDVTNNVSQHVALSEHKGLTNEFWVVQVTMGQVMHVYILLGYFRLYLAQQQRKQPCATRHGLHDCSSLGDSGGCFVRDCQYP